MEAINEEYTIAFRAYLQLLAKGNCGYKILSDSWATDGIPEGNWLNWSYDLLSRFDHEISSSYIDGYSVYFSTRLLRDEVFLQVVTDKLINGYGSEFLISWLNGKEGYRLIAYKVLSKKYHTIPEFDYMAPMRVRNMQISSIENFIFNSDQ